MQFCILRCFYRIKKYARLRNYTIESGCKYLIYKNSDYDIDILSYCLDCDKVIKIIKKNYKTHFKNKLKCIVIDKDYTDMFSSMSSYYINKNGDIIHGIPLDRVIDKPIEIMDENDNIKTTYDIIK